MVDMAVTVGVMVGVTAVMVDMVMATGPMWVACMETSTLHSFSRPR